MPLTKDLLEHFEHRLREERARVLKELNREVTDRSSETEEDSAGDLSLMPTHPADRGTDTMQEELDASNATRMSGELAEIDAALTRLYQSPETFGVCEESGENIPLARLEIIPWARTCEKAAS